MTLVELMVSLSIILIVTAVATGAYLKMLKSYKTQSKISESYISDITGLDLLRYDIQMAGYGIPSTINANALYTEAVDPASGVLPTGYLPTQLNDCGPTGGPSVAPRPLAILNNGGRNNSDVLSIKSMLASINGTARKWSMVSRVAGVPKVKQWGTNDFVAGDRFIVLDRLGALFPDLSGTFTCYSFNPSGKDYYTDATDIVPGGMLDSDIYFVYGLDSSAVAHRMPFNRVDYYLDTVTNANVCAPNTYTLYRSVVSNVNGLQTATPLVDCVMDFQVAFGLDNDGDQAVDDRGWVQTTPANAKDVRTKVREVRIFILYHEGVRDSGRTPDFRFSGLLNLGDQEIAASLDNSYSWPTNNFTTLSTSALTGTPALKTFDPSVNSDYARYRWKVLQLAIKPMNLKKWEGP